MAKRLVLAAFLAAAVLWVGCATPYMQAEQTYFAGDPAGAEKKIAPVAEQEAKKNGNMKNLYLWDLGVYRFAQGNYDGAIEALMQGVKDAEQIHNTGKTVAAALTSASSQKYVGDPVELSMAYLYIGLSYFMKGDYQNALVGFRRSLEEDLSKDETRKGDMGITNFLMGECCSRVGKFDDAIVAYRRAIEHEENLLPAYATLYWTLKRQGNTSDLARIEGEVEKRSSKEYLAQVDSSAGQGIVVAVFAGRPSSVKKDEFLGAFRKRDEVKQPVEYWELSGGPKNTRVDLFLSDNMHGHYTDQGGLAQDAKKQATRAVAAKAMSAIPILGLFAPSTDADLRFWPTIPGRVHVGYLPVPPGTYDLTVKGYDKEHNPLDAYSQSLKGIAVPEHKRALVVLTSWRTASLEQAR
jgi:tetratricopeptide (TPR) repeat protein